ncbi:MAG: DUF3291 domain-containing protein [Bacteroidota bacterium]
MEQQITTLSFFRFTSISGKLWAFWMMQFAHRPLRKVVGQSFYRIMGSGKARFNPWPDWGVYALLQTWESETSARAFFEDSPLFRSYVRRSQEQWTLYLRSMVSRGAWGGDNPFQKSSALDDQIPYVAVITRATIKTNLLFRFWKYVPQSQNNLWDNPGLLFSKGIGELPIKQMATFSLWKEKAALDQFAYQTRAHAKAIAMTRQLDWYSEELFSRFQPYLSVGSWEGQNPLPDLAKPGKR